jgi:shikimate dehydrogenase
MGQGVTSIDWDERHAALEGTQLLVNATNQGMHGEPALDLRLDSLAKNALVADVVYVPLETPLLRDAARRGHPTVNGIGMLVHQARLAFKLWFHVLPDTSAQLLAKVHATF